jgi:hypothetical protein
MDTQHSHVQPFRGEFETTQFADVSVRAKREDGERKGSASAGKRGYLCCPASPQDLNKAVARARTRKRRRTCVAQQL